MAEYTLTMDSSHMHEAVKAVELLMRLKLKQYDQIPFSILPLTGDDYCERRDAAEPHLKAAFDIMLGGRTGLKDDEWYHLYELWSVLRKAVHDAEHPEGKGADSFEAMSWTNDPLPACAWRKNG